MSYVYTNARDERMKNRGLMLVVLGLILLGIGVGLLVLASPSSSDSVFYIFPFFFFAASENMSLIVLIVLFVSCSSLLIGSQYSKSLFLQQSMITCNFCEESIHHGSLFCSKCGKRIETEGVN